MELGEEFKGPADLKACMNFKWTDDLTLQFILYRHERRHLFTKKRNTSKNGWQQILRDLGLTAYVTPYQAQKKWNNLWSKYKLEKKIQENNNENPFEEDEEINEAWPFFTVLDAIATGKVVTLTSHSQLESAKLSTSQESKEELILPGPIGSNITPKPTVMVISDEPVNKKLKTEVIVEQQDQQIWELAAPDNNDRQVEMVELLRANLLKLDEIKSSIDTQGKAIISLLSQLVNAVTSSGDGKNLATTSG